MENKNNAPVQNEGEDKTRRVRRQAKKRVCEYCQNKIEHVDYKDVDRLNHFIAENGKILPRRATGACAQHQREITVAVKNARIMALLPFKGE